MEQQKTFEILLIEDNPGDIHLTCEALREWGRPNRVTVVNDGVEAISYLRSQQDRTEKMLPDLIILDLNLPRKDGREVLSEIKSDRGLMTIPSVIFSTSDAEMDVVKTYSLGANCYVIKPIGIDNFVSTLKSILDFWLVTSKLPSQDYLQHRRLECEQKPATKTIRGDLRPTVRLLVVDDNPADADFVKEILYEQVTPSFQVLAVDRLSVAIQLLEQEAAFDAVLLDLGLPDSQGMDTYTQLSMRVPSIPIIINTVLDDDDIALRSIRSGAQDYIVKDKIDGTLLSRVIQHAMERKRLEEEKNKLVASEKMARMEAEKAILVRDDFLSIASHELKTPITTLILQAAVLKRALEKEANPTAEFTAKILRELRVSERQFQKLSELTENLLDISRISSGRLAMNFSTMNLSDLVSAVIQKLKIQIEQAKCELEVQIQPDVFGTWDSFRLEQVVVNLLTNALKYGRGKPISISVSGDTKVATFIIRDHGVGIAKEDQEKIFKRFERLSRTKNFGGLGLGLYIVRQIVDAHGGSIHVESNSDEGAVFKVVLPTQTRVGVH